LFAIAFARLTFAARLAWFTTGLARFAGFTRLAAFAAVTARLTRLCAFTARFALLAAFAARFATFIAFARFKTAAFAFAFRTEAIAAVAVAATALIAFTACALLWAFALRIVGIGLVVAAVLSVFSAFAFGPALVIAFIIAVIEAVVLLLLLHRHGGLHRAHETEIVIGVLHVVFAQHTVARTGGVASELQVAFKNVGGRTTDLDLGSVALERPVRVVVSATAAATLATVIIATTAARLTAAAPLTLHREFTIVLMVRFGRPRVAKGQPRNAPRFKKARSLWFGPCQAAPSAAK
jgi:hypothetical protein